MPCRFGVVVIFGLQGEFVFGFCTTVANEVGFFYLSAVFLFKMAAYIVAPAAGSAHGVTNEKLILCVALFEMKSMNGC